MYNYVNASSKILSPENYTLKKFMNEIQPSLIKCTYHINLPEEVEGPKLAMHIL